MTAAIDRTELDRFIVSTGWPSGMSNRQIATSQHVAQTTVFNRILHLLSTNEIKEPRPRVEADPYEMHRAMLPALWAGPKTLDEICDALDLNIKTVRKLAAQMELPKRKARKLRGAAKKSASAGVRVVKPNCAIAAHKENSFDVERYLGLQPVDVRAEIRRRAFERNPWILERDRRAS